MNAQPVVSPEAWEEARRELLVHEKELTRARDALAAQRRRMPWTAVEQVYRTYFVNNRADEALGSTWSYLDLTALGRQEEWEDSPAGHPQSPAYAWWRRHHEYEAGVDPWEGRLEEKVAANKEHARRSAG